MVPENALKVEFVAFITGHGWGNKHVITAVNSVTQDIYSRLMVEL